MSGAEVSAFLVRECTRVSVGSAKGRVAELRSLLRFLHLRGFTESSLGESVPPVAGWRETGIPRALCRAPMSSGCWPAVSVRAWMACATSRC